MDPNKVNGTIIELVEVLPENLADKFNFLISFFQAIGIFLILYVVYLIFNSFTQRKRNKEVEEISNKLDKLNKNVEKISSKLENNKNKK